MDGKLMAAFIIWAIVGCAFIGLGISAFFSKKAVGFWANAKPFPVEDIKGYNSAVGKLSTAAAGAEFAVCAAFGIWGDAGNNHRDGGLQYPHRKEVQKRARIKRENTAKTA